VFATLGIHHHHRRTNESHDLPSETESRGDILPFSPPLHRFQPVPDKAYACLWARQGETHMVGPPHGILLQIGSFTTFSLSSPPFPCPPGMKGRHRVFPPRNTDPRRETSNGGGPSFIVIFLHLSRVRSFLLFFAIFPTPPHCFQCFLLAPHFRTSGLLAILLLCAHNFLSKRHPGVPFFSLFSPPLVAMLPIEGS